MLASEGAAQRLQHVLQAEGHWPSARDECDHALGPKIVDTQAGRTPMNSMKRWGQTLASGFTSLFVTGIALAQGESTSTDVTSSQTTSSQVWYGQWWVWAVGIAVFLIVVIALTRSGRARD